MLHIMNSVVVERALFWEKRHAILRPTLIRAALAHENEQVRAEVMAKLKLIALRCALIRQIINGDVS